MKYIRNFSYGKKMGPSGQVALILVLIIAVALIFYAVIVNLGKNTQIKTLVTIASNTAGSLLASQISSYAEMLFQEYLDGNATLHDGKLEKCTTSDVWSALIKFIVYALIILIACCIPGAGPFIAAMIFSLVIQGVSTAISVGIQSEITSQWNKKMGYVMGPAGQFLENAILTALRTAVTDQVEVADLYDDDQDRKFGLDAGGEPKDKMARFAYYYGKRIDAISTGVIAAINAFLNRLEDFVYKIDNQDFGIYEEGSCALDPNSTSSVLAAHCNPNCNSSVSGMLSQCASTSIYGNNYPYLYDPFYEGINTVYSYREKLGNDDENIYFEKNSANPNGPQIYISDPSLQKFQIKDTTGYYSNDVKKGIYPLFYKLKDWGLDLSTADAYANREQCYLVDKDYILYCQGVTLPWELQSMRLELPVAPATLIYDQTPYVNGANYNVPGQPPLATDKISMPSGILAANNECAQVFLTDSNQGFWKKGVDKFCSTVYPYNRNCAKHGGSTSCGTDGSGVCPECGDSGTNSSLWNDDGLDDIVYNIGSFLDWARKSLEQGTQSINSDFFNWYGLGTSNDEDDKAWKWIEKNTQPACHICSPQGGYLWQAQQSLQIMSNRLKVLYSGAHANNYQASFSNGYDDAWCLPSLQSVDNGLVSQQEFQYFSSGNTSLEKVINCLNYNVNFPVTIGSGNGNAQRFYMCEYACAGARGNPIAPMMAIADQACGGESLPRSLVPGFNPRTSYVPYNGSNHTNASCRDYNLSNPSDLTTYMGKIIQSKQEAKNQVEKFRTRLLFLQMIKNNLDYVTSVLDEGVQEINNFLNSSAVLDLINARSTYNPQGPGALSNKAIYAWRDDPKKSPSGARLLWHIVRVDARLPNRCNDKCGISGDTIVEGDPGWPTVKTRSKGFLSTTRCYYLEEDKLKGAVKVRVVRYDEPSVGSSLLFPNGLPIWQFRYGPSSARTSYSPDYIVSTCGGANLFQLPATSASLPADQIQLYYQAFIMSQKSQNVACWSLLNGLLERGMVSETCAKYYYHEGITHGMGFKFIPCPAGTFDE